MPFVANDILEVKVRCDTPAELAVNVLHYKVFVVGGVPGTDIQACNAFFTRITASYAALMADDADLHQVTIQKILPAPAGAPAFSTSAPVAGTNVGDLLPRQVSGIITKRSVLAGRANRGRMYVPYPPESENTTNGVPTGSYVLKLDDLGDDVLVPFTLMVGAGSYDLLPVILHRLAGTTVGIASFTSRPYWGTQRRRNAF